MRLSYWSLAARFRGSGALSWRSSRHRRAIALPFRTEREGISFNSSSGQMLLLPVVHRNVFVFFALRIGSAGGDGACFTVGRYDNSTGDSDLSVLLGG